MVAYLILLVVIAVSGPFSYTFLGIRLKASHLHTPIEKLVVLLFLRLAITVELRNFLLLVGSIIFSLVTVEIALRIWDAPITRDRLVQIHRASPTLGWDLKPGSAGYGALGEFYQINAAGLRDTSSASPTKQAGTYRIVTIGDSFTFGMGVDLEDTYPKQLERILSTENLPVQVINCGVIGHNMWQHLETLKRKALPYQPDLIVLGIFEDDLMKSVRPPATTVEGYEGKNPFAKKRRKSLFSWSYLRNFLSNIEALYEHKYRSFDQRTRYLRSIADRKKMWGPENPKDSNYKIMAGKFENQFYAKFAVALGEFARAAEAAGSKVLVAMIPDSVQLNDPHMKVVNQFVSNAANEHRLPFLDLTPILEVQENLESLYLFPHDAHNSPKGLRLIAEAIAAKIIALQLPVAAQAAKERTSL
jgi:lysophospholipase L1-like esterase